MNPVLRIEQIDCSLGQIQVLHQVSLTLNPGEVHCLFGRNGAGKTTVLRAIMGQVKVTAGSIVKAGADITKLLAHQVPLHGIAYVPQGRRLFSDLTVAENLEIGLMARNSIAEVRDNVLALFPVLKQRMDQRSGSLSGGEQQMLAMARALCIQPDILLLDEPTEGLMPSMIARIRESVLELKSQGVAILLVEQRVEAVIDIADRISFIENGHIKDVMDVERLRDEPELVRRYVGIS